MRKTVKKAKIRIITRKTPKRRKKTVFSDAVRAFMLVGVIVAISALISCAVIMVHSSVNKEPETEIAANETEPKPAPKPVESAPAPITVTVDSPVRENRVPAAQPTPPASPITPPPAPKIDNIVPVAATVSSATIIRPPVENQGTLVFVIDDAGNSLRDLEPFLQVPGPLTIAVLPGLPNSAETARRIRAAGKEVILHQPMEAIGAQDPGPGAIYSGMSSEEIRSILARNIAEIGPVTGMNNHQGSKITMDKDIMKTILAFCVENNIYFLDSRTTAESVVPIVAASMNMKIAQRNIFIDNEQNKDSMLRYISGGLVRAQRNGNAILIGHIWSPDLAPLLTEHFQQFMEQGYTIKTVSDTMN